ncbi:MAG TPA: (2Fe-2S)-binding protein [Rubricoccaceae bacterium]
MSAGLGIDRCFCFGRTFASLSETAEATGAASVAELQQHAKFGQNCALCHPYVRRMLRTGETVFDEIVTEMDEPEQ